MRALKVIARTVLTLLAAFVVLCGYGEIHQQIVVHRAGQLLSDVHGLRLNQSTWADAQRFMTRWGKWGHYDGTCTSANCMYVVSIDSWPPVGNLAEFPVGALAFIHGVRLLPRQFGGGLRQLQGVILVENGIIRRSGLAIDMTVSPLAIGAQRACCGDELIISTLSRPSLGGIWAKEATFTAHPDYKVWRPGGCTFCLMGRVTFVDSVTPAEAARLSAFDLSCATRWSSCVTLEQLDPAARDWHLYGPPWGEAPDYVQPPPNLTATCRVPIAARARDADFVVTVDALEEPKLQATAEKDVLNETNHVRVIAQQKGQLLFPLGAVVPSISYGWKDGDGGPTRLRHLVNGHRYLVFIAADEDLQSAPHRQLDFQPCGIDDATPEAENEVHRGILLDDRLRGPELGISLNGFHRGVTRWDH